jgi:hypothetical protein
MAKFTIEITDKTKLAGITAAREAYNASLTEEETPLADDAAYVQFVMDKASESYARQYGG